MRCTVPASARGWLLVLASSALLLALVTAPADAAQFGVESGSFGTVLAGNHAGEHADLRTTFTFNQEPAGVPTGYVKDLNLRLPAGLIADPAATPRCLMGVVLKENCPPEDAVGVAEVRTVTPPAFEVHESIVFVYNVVPYPNEPAAFAFFASESPVRLDASLPAKHAYGLTMSATDLSDANPLISATVTLWGVPADHNGPSCHINEAKEEECVKFGGPGAGPRLPFLSNPVKCGSLPESNLSLESWQEPSAPPAEASGKLAPITSCEGLRFEPAIKIAPESKVEHEPTAYEIAVQMPSDQSPDGRAAVELKNARITLPTGTVISPSATTGLQACSDAQFEPPVAGDPESAEEGPAECPSASLIGSVALKTPVLAEAMKGELFLGTPECGPCTGQDAEAGRMIRVLVQAAGSGVLVKLHGSISVDQSTGRLMLAIDESPQLPLEELKLTLNGGSTALLANPSDCGVSLKGIAHLTPYSSETATEVSGAPISLTGCQAPQFAPGFTAGTVSNRAAGFSPAVVSISRTDQDQALERFTVKLPPGLLGLLSKVPACPQAAAQAGACPAQSQVGAVNVAAGPGEAPLQLKGSVFLTGPYAGAPFGLSIVVPALAGPIDLGSINIQAGIEIDPHTAALRIVSGPVPQSLAGIPLQIRALTLDIDREGFIVNPTDCRPQAIDATLASAQGASAAVATHFQVAGCAKLAFKPRLTALADAKTTRLGGAYVHVKVVSGPGQANVGKVKLDLPRALPSRLTTLQGACLEGTFKADPAHCPTGSILGTGAVTTPFLRGLLTGPIYLVSHGGRAFPDLDAVLQGEGVTLILTGTAGFARGGSYEAFRTLPDAPISTLDLMFPRSAHSAFAANVNLCKRALRMPVEITGQNGAVVKQTNTIAVAGCPGHGRSSSARRARARR
jgi:hypothetical protein